MSNLFTTSTLRRRVETHFRNVGKNFDQFLMALVVTMFEGKCCSEGFVMRGSCQFVERSAIVTNPSRGTVHAVVTFTCKICMPVRGTVIERVVCQTASAAGLSCKITATDGASLKILVMFDQEENQLLSDQLRTNLRAVREGDELSVTVISHNFQLEDEGMAILCCFTQLLPKTVTAAASSSSSSAQP